MTSLLILVIVALLGIAVWQLTKIFDLTQSKQHVGEDYKTQIATDKDNNINGYLMFGFLGFIYIFTIYSCVKWGYMPLLSNSASEHGTDVDTLMWISLVVIFIVQIVTQFLLHYFAFIYRGNKDRKATFYADNEKLEFIWTIIPVIVLAGLILYGLYAWNNIMHYDEEEDVMYVEVYAKQFNWDFRYAGDDNVLGKANVRFIEGINVVGADMADPNAQDDIITKELRLPVGKKVVLKMRSQDVLHSAYFPHFRAQMNTVPGMVTQFAMTPTVTTTEMRDREEIVDRVNKINEARNKQSKKLVEKGEPGLEPYTFDYILLCNKICGRSHYNMQAKVVVETEAQFRKWIAQQPKLGKQVAEEKAAATAPKVEAQPVQTPVQEPQIVVDTTAVVAQVIK
ncbi:cytochrome c oxidase subunit II [Paenimyroides viscosum]|jgi:cytochrome c oxidase subunit 2|uniref:Cytochrome c oxidase subunit 2 n=1 Tax=Paenimyroides viscosum TaxID=2488729 RepID=A0A3P1ATP1_9FLAO|nr:cytochrome c oxidase subunit II [Paenimyroides viscosum]RRA92341.1 cytochrome c oxidase subunit II [Paenimyroides viscosum]